MIIATSYPVAVGSDGAFYYPQVQSKGRVKIMRMLPGKKAQEQFAALPPVRERSYTGEWVDAEWVWAIAAGPNGSIYYTEKHAYEKSLWTAQCPQSQRRNRPRLRASACGHRIPRGAGLVRAVRNG